MSHSISPVDSPASVCALSTTSMEENVASTHSVIVLVLYVLYVLHMHRSPNIGAGPSEVVLFLIQANHHFVAHLSLNNPVRESLCCLFTIPRNDLGF